jgi:hypothetical protein
MRNVPSFIAIAAALAILGCDSPVSEHTIDGRHMAIVSKDTRVPFSWLASRCIGGAFVLVEGFYSVTITSDSVRLGESRTYGYHFVAKGIATDLASGVRYQYAENQSIQVKEWDVGTDHIVTSAVHSRLIAQGHEPDLHLTYLFHVTVDQAGIWRAYVENAKEVCTGSQVL